MIFGKSLKQLRRTPVTAALFMALFAVAAFFVCCGSVIWARNRAAVKIYEDRFITVGTVRQRPTSTELTRRWDAASQTYTRRNAASYSSIIPPSVLDFDGADYILRPEKRPYYGAWRPDLQLWPTDLPNFSLHVTFVVEATPVEDCTPDHPVELRVERVLSENPTNVNLSDNMARGDIILMCDHFNPKPQPLSAGKTYLMYLISNGTHDLRYANSPLEWAAYTVTFSSQYRPDGSPAGEPLTAPGLVEVTDGFYETEEGRRWLAFARSIHTPFFTLPVLPTHRTHLLLPFYNETAYIAQGEDISPEEYESGARVCLIPEKLARRNALAPGDTLRLPLYYADYQAAPNEIFPDSDVSEDSHSSMMFIAESPLDAEGRPYAVFSDLEYIIKGIYSNPPDGDAAFALGANTVVIPAKSVTEGGENNILAFGPMQYATTTFQIPNGSIEAFTERWLAQGVGELEFEFHDRGYTQLHRGLENMKRISLLFLAIGAVMSLALVFFFCHVFISKNRLRTAIERMLGYTKRQCAVSLLAGFLLAAALAAAAGCAAGIAAQDRITGSVTAREYYDTRYTIGPLGQDGVTLERDAASSLYAPAAGAALLLMTGLISAAFVRGNVRQEPLKLLGGRKEE